MRRCFIDTSALIAVAYADDTHHAAARETMHVVARFRLPQVTTSYVLAETYTVLRRLAGHRAAVAFGTATQRSSTTGRLTVVYPDAALEAAAWDIFARYEDQDFSFVDCVSFAWLKADAQSDVFAFDRHFDVMGLVRFHA
jgi:predicted nucleic acid-binding protein